MFVLQPKMKLLATVIFMIVFVSSCKDTASWTLTIKPEAGHIRVNKSTVILCSSTEELHDCNFKIDSRATMNFNKSANSKDHVITKNNKVLYRARYYGHGLENGQCGVGLSNMAAGVYVVGCQARNSSGSVRMNYMVLTVDASQPLRVNVNRKYQVIPPGNEAAILCSTERRMTLDHCALRLPSNQWVTFPKGHMSNETDLYHYHGRGLEKGHCGVTLVNLLPEDSGLVLCHLKARGKSAVRAAVVKVARPKPETQITWEEKTHLSPEDTLKTECVMRGAYPLPPMVWTYDSKLLKSSDVDDSFQESEFRWPWEDQVLRQNMSVPVGSKLGNKTLKCEAADVVDEPDLLTVTKYIVADRNKIVVAVHPTCGMRTNTTYFGFHRHKRHVRTSTTPSTTPSTLDADVESEKDYVEPVWDEHDQESVTLELPEATMSYSPPAAGLVGAVAVIGPEHFPKPFPPLVPRTEAPPAPIVGGKSVLGVGLDKIKPLTGNSSQFVISVGGTEVLKIPDSDYIDRLDSIGGISVVHPQHHASAGGIPVYNDNQDIHFEAYPWTAGVYKKITGKYSQQCGGTLVTTRHVICAAHCFWSERDSKPLPPDNYKVALGKIYRAWERADLLVQIRGVHKLHIHPVFRGRKRNYQHDISVIELNQEVVFTPRVLPACLDWDNYFEGKQLVNGSIGVVTGWGYTEDETPSDTLLYVKLPYVDANTCYDKLPEEMQLLLTTDKFCAGFSNKNISVCPGDSGGGLMFQEAEFGAYFLRGIVSVSFRPPDFQGKCYYSEVTGFTLVSQSLPWLDTILNKKSDQ